jgi:tRNA (guanine37-N1)-methyltransferase
MIATIKWTTGRSPGGRGWCSKCSRSFAALNKILGKKKLKTRTILFSTRGTKFDAKVAARLAGYDRIVMICGRYEGVDERVAEHLSR